MGDSVSKVRRGEAEKIIADVANAPTATTLGRPEGRPHDLFALNCSIDPTTKVLSPLRNDHSWPTKFEMRYNEDRRSVTAINKVLRANVELWIVWVEQSFTSSAMRTRIIFSTSDLVLCMLQCAFKVACSHNHKVRAVALFVLASMAQLIPEDLRMHHMIRESLDSKVDMELEAAIHATRAFGVLSSTLASQTIEKVAEMIASPHTRLYYKRELAMAVHKFKENLHCIKWKGYIWEHLLPNLDLED